MSNFPFYNQLSLSTWIAYPRAQFTIRGHGFVIQRHGLWFIKHAHRFHTECRFIFGSFVASADPSGALYIKQGREAKIMCRSMYIHTEKKKNQSSCCIKAKTIYMEGAMEVKQLACLSEYSLVWRHLLSQTFACFTVWQNSQWVWYDKIHKGTPFQF